MPKGQKRPVDPDLLTVTLIVSRPDGSTRTAKLKGYAMEVAAKLVHTFARTVPRPLQQIAPPTPAPAEAPPA